MKAQIYPDLSQEPRLRGIFYITSSIDIHVSLIIFIVGRQVQQIGKKIIGYQR